MCLDVFSIFDIYEFNSMMNNKRMVIVLMVKLNLIVFYNLSALMSTIKFSFMNLIKSFISIMSDQCSRSTSFFFHTSQLFFKSPTLWTNLVSEVLLKKETEGSFTSSHDLFTFERWQSLWMKMMMSMLVNINSTLVYKCTTCADVLLFVAYGESIGSKWSIERPITLSFRLAAIIFFGHGVLCLMTSTLQTLCLVLSNVLKMWKPWQNCFLSYSQNPFDHIKSTFFACSFNYMSFLSH
uniref:ATP synthase F0 subunit 6 n=1 Tax=Hirudo nipponia TaxID=42736 RepID=X2C8P1_HIRNI|nr:ATP synthase F0 subunit 6 [Hirudo nipponia]AGL10934.1 ATP synthase F0 subunit 6 [Hirudo nipponia]